MYSIKRHEENKESESKIDEESGGREKEHEHTISDQDTTNGASNGIERLNKREKIQEKLILLASTKH